MRISDWSSDVCSSDLERLVLGILRLLALSLHEDLFHVVDLHEVSDQRHDFGRHAHRVDDLVSSLSVVLPFVGVGRHQIGDHLVLDGRIRRSEEHPSELQSLMRISYAVFCLKKKKKTNTTTK